MKIIGILLGILLTAGCSGTQNAPEKITVEFVLAESEPSPGLTAFFTPELGDTFYLDDQVLLTNADIISSSLTEWDGRPGVEVIFSEEGAKKFAEITEANINKRMAMLVDGKLVTAPVIRAKIPGGRAIINGIFTVEEAERIAQGIVRK